MLRARETIPILQIEFNSTHKICDFIIFYKLDLNFFQAE